MADKNDRIPDHKSGFVIWMTGLSGAGKSTIATEVVGRLQDDSYSVVLLDGDELRTGLNADLDFTKEGRNENIRRTAEVAKLFADNGSIVVTALISPFTSGRELARSIIGEHRFYEVFVNASLQTCESRDVKGLYKRARSGEIADFTGIDSPYQQPQNAGLELNTETVSKDVCVEQLIEFVHAKMNEQ